jgi:hypothetical protein
MHGFGQDSLAGHERWGQPLEALNRPCVVKIGPVQQGDERAGIDHE